jgi:hypothetical protein
MPAGSNRATHISMRSKSFGPESRIHFGACLAMAASSLATNRVERRQATRG